jgi:hypothetical protein
MLRVHLAEPSIHPKLFYFASRHPTFDRRGFIERWRQHARLGMRMARWKNIRRYVHCDVVEGPDCGLPLGRCDGVAILWYHSEKARLAHVADRSAAPIMREDELATFDRPVRDVSVLTEEVVFQPHGRAPKKLILRLWRQLSMPAETFKTWLLEDWGPSLERRMQDEGLTAGLSQNAARPLLAELPLYCDAVTELDCIDPEGCAAEMRSQVGRFAERLGHIEGTWAEETVLYSL